MKRTSYLITLFCYLMMTAVIGRLAFLYYNRSLAFFTVKDVIKTELLGLPMDTVIVSAIVFLPVVLTLLSCLWPRLAMRRILGPYLWLVIFLALCITCADFIMYEHWKFKLDASIFAYMSEPGEMSSSEPMSYLVSRIGLSVLAACLAGVIAIFLTPKSFAPGKRSGGKKIVQTKKSGWGLTVVSVLCLLPLALGLTGIIGEGLAFRKVQIANKNFSVHHNTFLSHAAVSPVLHMAHSMLLYRKPAAEQFRLMEKKEAGSVCSSLFPIETEDLTDTLFTTTRPNILTLQIESMGAVFVEALGGEQARATGKMSGEPETVTPEVCRWMTRSLNFTQAYATSFRTDRGTVSVISGQLSFPTVSLMMEDSVLTLMEQGKGLPALPTTLTKAGYTTSYLYGGNPDFMNKGRYLSAAGYQKILGIEDIDVKEEERDGWGANDSIAFERLFTYVTEKKAKEQHPWYVGFQTMSSHEPWDVPYSRLWEQIPNAFAYTDHCLGQFLDRLSRTEAWDNLIVVIFADHGYPYHQFYDNPEFFHIPLFIVGGALKKTGEINTLISQSDIAATLLAQMNISHRHFPWSRNVFSENYAKQFIYASYPSGVVLKDNRGFSMYDLQSDTFTSKPDAKREKQLKAILQDSYENL